MLVPTGHLYLLGDNRDDSVDSRMGADTRWSATGTVPVEYVFGSVEAIGSWPFDMLKPIAEKLLERSEQP